MRSTPTRSVHRHDLGHCHRLSPLARAVGAITAAGLLAAPVWLHASTALPNLPNLPNGLQVVQGQATVATQGALMTVKNSNNAILNWQSFNIGTGAGVHFQQANAASKVLNRVVGHDPSSILGSLSSNGQVWLLNPNGVLFGQGARVDVSSLVASTLRLNDHDFLSRRYRFSALDGDAGALRNEGSLRSSFGGQVVLLGTRVENTGSVLAEGGSVALAAARSVELVDTGLPHLAVKVELAAGAGGEVNNLGRLAAPGGKIDVFAGIVNQQGLVQADTLGTDAFGRVTLQAAQSLTLAAVSSTQAAGGTLRLDAGAQGLAVVNGTASTASAHGAGGDLLLQGQRILVGGTAVLDASGATGGGLLRVGGDFQGKNAAVRNADMVTVLRGAQLHADATASGDGGTVIVWSDSATRFGGHASARGAGVGGNASGNAGGNAGGNTSGNGGLVEVSAKGYLDYRGSADLRAAGGREGLLLLDPTNLTIQFSGPDIDGSGGGGDDLVTPTLAFAAPGVNSIITAAAVVTQLASANVTLQATNDITLATGLTSASANALTLQAGNNINLNAAVTLGGALTLSANDPGGPASGIGRVASSTGINIGAAALRITNNGGSGTHILGNIIAAGNVAVVGNVQLITSTQLNVGAGLSSIPGVISGGVNEAFTKNGAGTLVLTANNTYAGVTLINAGTLRIAGATAAPGTGLVSLGGGTLDLTDGAILTRGLNVGFGSNGLANSSGAATITGNISINGNLAVNSSGSGILISGSLGGSTSSLALNSGTLTLTAGNSGFFGSTSINAGTLRVSGTGAGLAGSVSVEAAGTLDIANGATLGSFGSVASAGGTIGSSAGTGTLNGFVSTQAGVNTFGIAGPGGLVVNAPISGASAGLSIAGPVSFTTANTYTGGTSILPTGVLTLNGQLASVAGTINVGAGRLAAGNAANVPNALTINGGQLETTSSGFFNGPITLNGNVQLVVGGGSSVLDIASAISGTGGIVVPASGIGNITLRGSNTYGGTTALTGGTLQLNNGAAIPDASAVTLTAGSTLRLLGAETIGSLTGAAGSTVALGNAALTAGGNGGSTTFAGVFTGDTGPQLVKQGAGVFTLTGTSSVTAPMTVAAGTLQISGAGANAGLGGINLGAAGTLDISSGASVANTVQVANGATIRSSTGNGALAAGTLTQSDGATLNLAGGVASRLTVGRAINNVAGGAPEAVSISGGEVAFTLANTYTGGTTVTGTGNAVLNAAAASLGTGAISVAAGGALAVNNGAAVANAITLAGGSIGNTAGTGTVGGTVTLSAASSLNGNGTALSVSGPIVGAGGLFTNGNVSFSGGNSYTGQTGVTGGTLTAAGADVLPDTGTVSISPGATLLLSFNEAIGGLANAGTINLGANSLTLNNAAAATVSGAITGTGRLIKDGVGSLTVTGTLGYTGLTIVNQGTLAVDAPNTLAGLTLNGSGTLAGSGALTVSGPFIVSGNSKTLGGSGALLTQGTSLVDLGGSTGGTLTLTRPWTNSGTLNLGGDETLALDGLAGASLTNAASGTLLLLTTSATAVRASTGTAVINNQGTLLKANAGSTDLGSAGATSFGNSGLINVSGGTLGVLGTFTQTGVIEVGSGATFLAVGLTNGAGGELRGNGSIGVTGGSPLLNQGLVSPGGTGVVGALTLTGAVNLTGGTLAIDLAGTSAGSFDRLITTGPTLQLGGALVATLRGSYAPANADFMPVLLVSGSVAGSFASTNLPSGFVAGYSLAAGEAVRLVYSTAGTTRIFTNAAGNLDWSTPANWGGTLPGPADEALISSGFAVTHAAGTDTITALTINAANSLQLSGGSLTVTGATLLGGSLGVSGTGTLTLAGAVTGGGAVSVGSGTLNLGGAASFASLVMTGGVLGGSGSLGVVGNFNRSGGTIASGYSSISLTQNSGELVPGGALFAGSVTLNSQDPAAPLNLLSAVVASGGDVVISGAVVNAGAALSGQRVFVNGRNGMQFNAGSSAVATLAGGNAIVIESGGYFRNLAGPSVFSVAGGARWLVYSADPGTGNTGGLVPAFKQYNAAIGAAPAAGGNGLLYALAPTLVAALQGPVAKVYDTTTTATLAAGNFVLSGALVGDAVTLNPVGAGTYTTAGSGSTVAGVGTGKTVLATGLSTSATDTATGAPVFGYQFSGTASGAVGSITPAALLVSGYTANNKVYDGALAALVSGSGSFTPLGSDSVTLAGTASGSFADKNVGNAKPVTLGGLSLAGSDAANYTLVLPGGLTANITARALTVSGLLALGRVYDATTAATLGGVPVLNAVGGDVVTLGGTATASFANKNVGAAKPVTVTGYGLAGGDAGNYTLVQPTGLTANITARPLGVAGLTAANRVYNAGTGSTLTGTPAVTPLAGDAVTVAGTALGTFVEANVGTAKPLVLSGLTLGGADGANYAPVALPSLVANITPATLSFVATGLTAPAGIPLPTLGGTVTGFVGAETQASATTGTLAFTSNATLASAPGSYSISGGGLVAQNYVFTQAAANATALRLTPAPGSAGFATNALLVALQAGLDSVQVQLAMSTPTLGRVLDVLPALGGSAGAGGPGGPAGPVFRAMNYSLMTRPELQTLLAARDRYKKQVFANGLYKLDQDPTLADVRPCKTEAELSSGNCLITEALKQEIQQIQARAARATPGATATTAQAAARQPDRRRVRQAALPNIERKLALLIGVNSYRDKRVPALAGAVPDARAVRTLLENRLGYEATVLEDPSREAIIRAFNKIALQADANDSVVIYYAGHGVVIPVNGVDTGFWLPSDTNAEDPGSWLSNADIARMVAAVGSRQLMLVSDSCYSGSLVGSEKVQVSQSTDARDLLSRKAAVVLSSGGNEPVADEGRDGHSIFAWHFMRALENVDTWQVGGNVFERVRAAVNKEFPQTPQYGASRPAGHQGNTDFLYERREIEAAAPAPAAPRR